MKSFNSPPLLVLCALLGVAVAAAPAHAQHLRLELTNADFYSVLLRNASGQEHGPGSGFFPGLGENEIPGVSFSVASEASIDFVLPSGASFELDFAGKGQPVEVRLRSLDGSDHVTRVVRWEGVAVPAGAAGILELDAAGGGVLRVAPVAGGVANTVVPASVDVSGAAAGDQTPPEIVHQRAFNGQHTLQLLDGGVDITGEGRLYVSLDGGQGYEAYTAPLQIDSRETPTLYAIGRDRLGNTSSLRAISTVADFCARVADDRAALQSIARDGLARTLADGLLSTDPGVALLAHGDAACLFRRDAGGADASCAACQGLYAPGHSEVGLAVLFPDGTPAATQGALIGHLEAVASEQSTLEAVRASAESRSAFETGSVDLAPGSDFGLARQLRSLEWALAGEYVEALPGMPGVSGLPLGDVADALQAAGGIPSMDGHEAARLGEWEMLKSGVMLRIADLAQGAVPTEPERDRFENRILRRQLETAAGSRVRASLGALAADNCAAGNGLVSVSRAGFQSTACAGAGCRSFAEYVAARALESRTLCPALFSDEAVLGLAESVELAQADATLLARVFGDECEANALLASALLELRALAESTRPSYEAGLAASSLAERNQRVQNLQDLDAARLARLSPATQRLRLMVANPTEQAIGGARLRMYEDGVANGQVRDLEVPARTRRILEGDPAIGLPFYLERDVQTQPNEIHHVVFQLEEGGGTAAPVGDRTFAGYDYYVFDPSQVICPVQTPPVAPQPGATVP